MSATLQPPAPGLQPAVRMSVELESLTEQFTVLSEDRARVDPGVWQRAARAIDQEERLRMRYQRFDGVVRDYEVEPYHLAAYHGNWYLVALNGAAGCVETFALSRCRSLAGSGEYFTRPTGFEPRAFFKGAFGISQAERPWRVRLVFSREVATYIGERLWHPEQRMRWRRDGALELRMETSSRKELTRWILSWVPYVRVLGPLELRERVRERLRRGLAACG